MRWRTALMLVGGMAVGAWACSAGSTGGADAPGPSGSRGSGAGGSEATGGPHSPLLVLRASAGLGRGDTLDVDTTAVTEDLEAGYRRGAERGTVSLERLGIVGRGMMVVSAERARVRRCRSKGCSVIGYVGMGQPIHVHDYADGWYRFVGTDGVEGYVFGEDLELPLVQRQRLLVRIHRRTASYFERELQGLPAARSGAGTALFEGWELRYRDGLLSFEFYTPFVKGEGAVEVCNAMRGIAAFVEGLMSELRSELFPAYSAGIYYDAPGTEARDDVMVAGLTGDGATYCRGL